MPLAPCGLTASVDTLYFKPGRRVAAVCGETCLAIGRGMEPRLKPNSTLNGFNQAGQERPPCGTADLMANGRNLIKASTSEEDRTCWHRECSRPRRAHSPL